MMMVVVMTGVIMRHNASIKLGCSANTRKGTQIRYRYLAVNTSSLVLVKSKYSG